MKPVDNEVLLNQLKWRYAVKKFDSSRKVSNEDWRTLEQAVLLSPSSFGLQPWRFLVITNQAKKEELLTVSWNQRQIADCSHLVVFASRHGLDQRYIERFIQRTAQVRGIDASALEQYKQMMIGSLVPRPSADLDAWCARQTYIALGTLLTSAAVLGIDACPMEGIDPAKYNQILGLTDKGYGALCVAAVGYRSADDPYSKLAKVRFDPSEVIEHIA